MHLSSESLGRKLSELRLYCDVLTQQVLDVQESTRPQDNGSPLDIEVQREQRGGGMEELLGLRRIWRTQVLATHSLLPGQKGHLIPTAQVGLRPQCRVSQRNSPVQGCAAVLTASVAGILIGYEASGHKPMGQDLDVSPCSNH